MPQENNFSKDPEFEAGEDLEFQAGLSKLLARFKSSEPKANVSHFHKAKKELQTFDSDHILSPQELSNIIQLENDREGKTLKSMQLTGMTLLLKNLQDLGIDTSNVLLIDDAEGDLPILTKTLKMIAEGKISPKFLIHKLNGGHDTLMAFTKNNEKLVMTIIDSLGTNSTELSLLIEKIKYATAEYQDNLYLVITEKARQKDHNTCGVFVYKDLKALLQDPEFLTEIIKSCENTLIPLSQGINLAKALPKQMLKMTQYPDAYKENHDYIDSGKKGFGVESPIIKTIEKGSFFERTDKLNLISSYFLEKYLQDKIPEIVRGMNAGGIMETLNLYDAETLLNTLGVDQNNPLDNI